MNVAQGFLKVEVLVHFLRRDTDITAGREAPVIGLDLSSTHKLDKASYIEKLRFREAFRQPMGLFPEITNLLELFNSQLPGLVGGLAGACNVAVGPCTAIAGVALVLAGFDEAAGKLVEQVYLLNQAADRLGDGVEGLARGILIPPPKRKAWACKSREKVYWGSLESTRS